MRTVKSCCVIGLLLAICIASTVHADYAFSTPIKISTTSNISSLQQPIVRGENVFLVWAGGGYDEYGYQFSRIYFAKSTDRGEHFSDAILIAEGHLINLVFLPTIAVDESGENIHLTWHSYAGRIYYSKSNDGGISFSPPRHIAEPGIDVTYLWGWSPSIAIFDQNVYITYARISSWMWTYEHAIMKSMDGGETFTTPVRLPISVENINYAWSGSPIVNVDSFGSIYVAWAGWFYGESAPYKMLMAKSVNQGETFSSMWVGSPSQGVGAPTFKIGRDGAVYLAWQEYKENNWSVYFSKSIRNDEILDFGLPVRVNDQASYSISPGLDIDSAENIYIVWEDGRSGDSDMYLAKSTDGSSFEANELVAGGTNPQTSPACAVGENGDPYVVWIDTRPDENYFPPFASDLYFSKGALKDTIPPETSILSGPTGWINTDTATFVFSGEDNLTPTPQLSYSYKLDEGEWSSYSTSTEVMLTGLSEGTHAFYIKAKDLAGNEDITPAIQSFSVDTMPPSLNVQITPDTIWPPDHRMVDVSIDGTVTDAGSGVSGLSIKVIDEYGGELYRSGFGIVQLEAWRTGDDKDGRFFNIIVTAIDNAGNTVNKSGIALVPHDQRK